MRYAVFLLLIAWSTAAAQIPPIRPVVFGGIAPKPKGCIGSQNPSGPETSGICRLGRGTDVGLGVLISDRAIVYGQFLRMTGKETYLDGPYSQTANSLEFRVVGIDYFLPATRRRWARVFASGGVGRARMSYGFNIAGGSHSSSDTMSARNPAVSFGAGLDIRAGRHLALTPRLSVFQTVGGKTRSVHCDNVFNFSYTGSTTTCGPGEASIRYKLPTLEITFGWR